MNTAKRESESHQVRPTKTFEIINLTRNAKIARLSKVGILDRQPPQSAIRIQKVPHSQFRIRAQTIRPNPAKSDHGNL
jgi:hypothetical protein